MKIIIFEVLNLICMIVGCVYVSYISSSLGLNMFMFGLILGQARRIRFITYTYSPYKGDYRDWIV
jgi:hypothetical protein